MTIHPIRRLNFAFAVFIVMMSSMTNVQGQARANDDNLIKELLNKYSQSVINRDSSTFYGLFNDGPVMWCSELMPHSFQESLKAHKVLKTPDGFSAGSYKGFMRALYKYRSTEDKFDRVRINKDGTVASVMMDYSFWANGSMTNWGCKLLTLIKRGDSWKITSVSYSIELVQYQTQPPLEKRISASND